MVLAPLRLPLRLLVTIDAARHFAAASCRSSALPPSRCLRLSPCCLACLSGKTPPLHATSLPPCTAHRCSLPPPQLPCELAPTLPTGDKDDGGGFDEVGRFSLDLSPPPPFFLLLLYQPRSEPSSSSSPSPSSRSEPPPPLDPRHIMVARVSMRSEVLFPHSSCELEGDGPGLEHPGPRNPSPCYFVCFFCCFSVL